MRAGHTCPPVPSPGRSIVLPETARPCWPASAPDGWCATGQPLEEQLDRDGIPVRLVDTAGLRQVSDPAETEGVRRADAARKEADLVLLVFDGSRQPRPLELSTLKRTRERTGSERTVVVVNKADLEPRSGGPDPYPGLPRVSALTGEGVDDLRQALRTCLIGTGPLEDPIITNARHAGALEQARGALVRAAEAQAAGLSEELVLEDLRQAMRCLADITGEFTTEDLYDRIFSTFCIGK